MTSDERGYNILHGAVSTPGVGATIHSLGARVNHALTQRVGKSFVGRASVPEQFRPIRRSALRFQTLLCSHEAPGRALRPPGSLAGTSTSLRPVWGEHLPPRLDDHGKENPRLLVQVRPAVHRVINLETVDERNLQQSPHFAEVNAPLMAMGKLDRLPLDGRSTSFFYQDGPREGHVKGSIKAWESLLLSLPSWDFFVGSDKACGDRRETGNTFYTSLKPWNHAASDMWDFPRFLTFWGWRL